MDPVCLREPLALQGAVVAASRGVGGGVVVPETEVASPQPRRTRLLDGVDWAWILGLMAAGMVARLCYWSGFGLIDDVLFRHFIASILWNHGVLHDNFTYRFTWWIPTALFGRALGLSERSMILPITFAATLGTGVVYALGKQLFGRSGAIIAALLLVVAPIDFAWSTMLANDIFFSVCSAVFFLCVLRALEVDDDPLARRRRWILAGVFLLLSYHAKASAPSLVPPLVLTLWMKRRSVDRTFTAFLVSAGTLLGASALVSIALSGDPLIAIDSELAFQGLTGQTAVDFHPLHQALFWTYPRLMFYPDNLGDRIYSVYPQLLIACALVAPFLRLRTSWVAFWWFLFVFAGMQFNIQHVNGVWVAGFRNIRHTHVFVYPMILLLAGYLSSLHARFPRLGTAVLVVLVGYSAMQSRSTAYETHVAFEDRRQACHFLATLPRKLINADFQINIWMSILQQDQNQYAIHEIPTDNTSAGRRAAIQSIRSGYIVTGGAREPYYGCWECTLLADELPKGRWHMLFEYAGPDFHPPWRQEPIRVWEGNEEPEPSS
jgi:hypothetical protein